MKRWFSLACILLVVLSLCSCSIFPYEDSSDLDLTQEEIDSVQNATPTAISTPKKRTIKTISIYTVDTISEELMPITVPLYNNEITPAFITDEVINNLEDTIKVTELTVERKQLFVTLDSNYAPIKNCSRKYETLVLDCLANSLLDNLSYVDDVIFRSDTGAYHSANYDFEINEVYRSK
ncbi:MAG: hypothetical protein ACI4SQ_06105 [Eubacterium sp.]